jgi:DNA-binding transcriptional regulator YiaG
MPNIALALKQEIRRLARREVKAETNKTKQAVSRYRLEIARLKRELQQQQKIVQRLESQQQKLSNQPEAASESVEGAEGLRFSARSVRSQRRRLGLSAEDFGRLIGVSGLTIYNWESGKTRPRQPQFLAFAAVRNLGRREAQQRLSEEATA